MAQEIFRLSKENIEFLEMVRKDQIKFYKDLLSNDQALLSSELERWEKASYNELLRVVFFHSKYRIGEENKEC